MNAFKYLAIVASLTALSIPAFGADHDRYHDRDRGHGPRWHGDIHRFHEHDIDIWRHGYWRHGRHLGRAGWWWVVGGVWYFYPAPVYPYPDPYLPPAPPVVVAPPVQNPLPPAQYWYYCPDPEGYYPYVPQCRVPWERVPASPPLR